MLEMHTPYLVSNFSPRMLSRVQYGEDRWQQWAVFHIANYLRTWSTWTFIRIGLKVCDNKFDVALTESGLI